VALNVGGYRIRWFFLFQLLSSVFGIVALAIWAWRQPPGRYPRALPKAPVSNVMRLRAVFAIISVSSTFAIAGYIANADLHLQARVFHFLIGGITGLVLAWCAVALVFRRHSGAA
jgi:cytosine/uracil/thiamine/allantoin permease